MLSRPASRVFVLKPPAPLFLSHLLLSCQDEDPLILAAPSLAVVCGYKLCLVGSTLTEEAKEGDATLPDVRLPLIPREHRGDIRITKADDVRVLDDTEELLRGKIEKKQDKKRPAHIAILRLCWELVVAAPSVNR
ncbi:hypothetical protein BGY98DRAFT_936205 [Russula aff. rugulosa BPL654]|nr:hypothetical protein BGY98DRAFT_936205 [Russula aff. rugulosa BPL654]